MNNVQFLNYYQDNYSALLNFAKKLTKDANDAEDLLQETAMKAFKSFHTFRLGTSFKSWSFTILKNTFISNYRRKRRNGVVNTPVEDMAFAIEHIHTVNNNAYSDIRTNEINECISDLTEKSKVPFVMYVTGYQYNEIAESLDLPIGTVKSRINFARKKLKEMMLEKNIVDVLET